jgi:hypothetical protein
VHDGSSGGSSVTRHSLHLLRMTAARIMWVMLSTDARCLSLLVMPSVLALIWFELQLLDGCEGPVLTLLVLLSRRRWKLHGAAAIAEAPLD